jgi:hypothetical protein
VSTLRCGGTTSSLEHEEWNHLEHEERFYC